MRYSQRFYGEDKGGLYYSILLGDSRDSLTDIERSVFYASSNLRPTFTTGSFEGTLFVAAFLLYMSDTPSTDLATLPVVVPVAASSGYDSTTVFDIFPVGFP